jgi:hypothetical protein
MNGIAQQLKKTRQDCRDGYCVAHNPLIAFIDAKPPLRSRKAANDPAYGADRRRG